MIMDEMAPKATGREAQLDKKLAAGARLKGAAADREESRDGMEVIFEDFCRNIFLILDL